VGALVREPIILDLLKVGNCATIWNSMAQSRAKKATVSERIEAWTLVAATRYIPDSHLFTPPTQLSSPK
jgi:hypothetical protein